MNTERASIYSNKITTAHRAKTAFVYIRQSTMGQVIRHGESTEMQYRLVERAIELGWPAERVMIVDEDLGKSGSSSDNRTGFQKIASEIGMGQVGLVLSFDASRLARNNRDWYQMLELCSLFGTLIADNQVVYDPRQYHARLLLGLSGMMSEAELYQIKQRLYAGVRQKAERGSLRLSLPAGLSHLPNGEVIVNPDEEVQARIRLVFDKFKELGTAFRVMQYFLQHQLHIPTRPIVGPAPHVVVWQPADHDRIISILKNPAYAGAYTYGKHKRDPTRRRPNQPYSGNVPQPMEAWHVLLHDHYPAYISWEEYLSNLAQLKANMNHFKAKRQGAPKKGSALLQGIVHCGKCGGHLHIRYSGPKNQYPAYHCSYVSPLGERQYCQQTRALGVDDAVEKVVLAALEPDKIAIALHAIDQLEHEQTTLERQWQLRLERAHYEAARAERQFQQVEPENRLVARSLEAHWEGALRAADQVEREHRAWQQQQPLKITSDNYAEIAALADDFPCLWYSSTTTAIDKKRIIRLLIKSVIIDHNRVQGLVWFQINWQTGAITEHTYKRRVLAYKSHADIVEIENRIRQMHAQKMSDEQIAEQLNCDGIFTIQNRPFNYRVIWGLRKRMGLPAVGRGHPDQWKDGTYSIQGAAKVLELHQATIAEWIYKGWLDAFQQKKAAAWHIVLTPTIIEELKAKKYSKKRAL